MNIVSTTGLPYEDIVKMSLWEVQGFREREKNRFNTELYQTRLVAYYMTINNGYLESKYKPKTPKDIFEIPELDSIDKVIKPKELDKEIITGFNIIN